MSSPKCPGGCGKRRPLGLDDHDACHRGEIDCLRAQLTTEQALSDALAGALRYSIEYVPTSDSVTRIEASAALDKHRAARAKDLANG